MHAVTSVPVVFSTFLLLAAAACGPAEESARPDGAGDRGDAGHRSASGTDAGHSTERKKPARHSNHLIHEKSPYLLQHAWNPVDWYPWGPEAFEKARREDKPIFLSIGYATCHWCHVMEHESFEDPQVARILNDGFVCIKVDREERPDIDAVYMRVCQAMTGGGGWPLSIIMTPDKRAFFAGTYIPKESRFGRRGLLELLPAILDAWKTRRGNLERTAEEIQRLLAEAGKRRPEAAPDTAVMRETFAWLQSEFDTRFGGFGRAPKFPTLHNLLFLLRYRWAGGPAVAEAMVERTLQAMYRGGIWDQVGFGLHRYSTDRKWLVPHFEKMLYDQAMLLLACVEAYQSTGREVYARMARETAEYVLRDLALPSGLFCCAEDADSEGVEGRFYVWTWDEFREAVGRRDLEFAARVFGVRKGGNFPSFGQHTVPGGNILHYVEPPKDLARESGMSVEEFGRRVESVRQRLFRRRQRRPRPLRDDKVLTDWNGMMIAALARAGAVLDDLRLVAAAEKAADGLRERVEQADGRLYHRWRDGEAAMPGFLDDYAYLAWGLIELYAARFQPDRLIQADGLVQTMLRRFQNENGAFRMTADDAPDAVVPAPEATDGAYPSGNSVAVHVLLRLAALLGKPEYEEAAARVSAAFGSDIRRMPTAYTFFQAALLPQVFGMTREIVLAAPALHDLAGSDFASVLRSVYDPGRVVLAKTAAVARELGRIAPWTRPLKPPASARTAAFVCRNHACRLPVLRADALYHDFGNKAFSGSR